jgi:hypothetical protein
MAKSAESTRTHVHAPRVYENDVARAHAPRRVRVAAASVVAGGTRLAHAARARSSVARGRTCACCRRARRRSGASRSRPTLTGRGTRQAGATHHTPSVSAGAVRHPVARRAPFLRPQCAGGTPTVRAPRAVPARCRDIPLLPRQRARAARAPLNDARPDVQGEKGLRRWTDARFMAAVSSGTGAAWRATPRRRAAAGAARSPPAKGARVPRSAACPRARRPTATTAAGPAAGRRAGWHLRGLPMRGGARLRAARVPQCGRGRGLWRPHPRPSSGAGCAMRRPTHRRGAG